ncbi:hypothetical protein M514_10961 [Trichuris suis]|uniref:MAM domain-containing protein n=1 Tax=Trichuris suis TaxID=68888 RepID=A0A085MXG5_9BILA|nr:hypothetical protein M513_10961 [Trichuris suis]KFD61911.1 hypothetical protein M514_10961 [Trichuris suis]
MTKDHLCFAYVSNVLLLFTAVIGARLRINRDSANPLQGWLGGTLRTDQPVGSTTAKQLVSQASDLNCYDLNAQCLWRNEAAQDVSIRWVVGSGEPDLRKFRVPMRTQELPGGNDGKFLAALAEQPHTAEQKALLVSSVIQCQKSTGTLKFRPWISPRAKLMVCTRVPGSTTSNQNCVEIFRKSNGVIANVPIAAQPNNPFEIVFEASNFVVRRPRALPGTIIIDDITYEAELCSKGATSATLPPRVEQPSRPHNVQQFANACNSLKCSFENGVGQEHRACPNYIQVNVKVTSGTFGNRHTGIKDSVKNAYGYVSGPGDLTILQSQSFSIPTAARLKFCYNSPSHDSQLVVTAYKPSGKSVIFTTPEFDVSKAKEWKCPTVLLDTGTYNTIEFVAKKLRNEYSLLAIDEITLVDVSSGANLC